MNLKELAKHPTSTDLGTVPSMSGITAEESRLYDRQIRLWGATAQRRMKQAKVLLINMAATNVEVCKNLVLAGVSVSIVDTSLVSVEDVGANFFVSASDIGSSRAAACAARARELNPFASVNVLEGVDVAQLCAAASPSAHSTLEAHTVVCAVSASRADRIALDAACRHAQRPFVCAETHGMIGAIFIDAGAAHEYVETKAGGEAKKNGKRTLVQPSMAEVAAVDWSVAHRMAGPFGVPPAWFALEMQAQLGEAADSDADAAWGRAIAVSQSRGLDLGNAELGLYAAGVRAAFDTVRRSWGCEVGPVCAVLGGVLGQEVIKIISRTNAPVSNYMVYDAWRGEGREVYIASKPPPKPPTPAASAVVDDGIECIECL